MSTELLQLLDVAKSLNDNATHEQYVRALNQHSRQIDLQTAVVHRQAADIERLTASVQGHAATMDRLQAHIDANLRLQHVSFAIVIVLVAVMGVLCARWIERLRNRIKFIEGSLIRFPQPIRSGSGPTTGR